ncbi:acyl-CoA dehydrogenase family protein [Desertimonas flava]|uniref:acyl-CoA dehydrogenase family protein n=1 Tax=Desertimonas flava TaxID=2064846 RepID=UPI0013C48FE0|nr:acyl-CoA dehydrogenase family protein [Desertimonas flava]
MTGGADFNQVFLDGVRVPDDHRLGDVDDGWRVAISTLSNERVMIGDGTATATSLVDRSLSLMRAMGRQHDPFTRQRAAYLVAHQMIMALTNRRFARRPAIVRRAPRRAQRSLPGRHMRRISAFVSSLLGCRLTADTGEWGTFAWSQVTLGEPALHLAGGTDEVIRNVLAERALGLPRDPR